MGIIEKIGIREKVAELLDNLNKVNEDVMERVEDIPENLLSSANVGDLRAYHDQRLVEYGKDNGFSLEGDEHWRVLVFLDAIYGTKDLGKTLKSEDIEVYRNKTLNNERTVHLLSSILAEDKSYDVDSLAKMIL